MPINKEFLFDYPTGNGPVWNWIHSYATLAELSYWPDLNWDNRWADIFGFATSKTIVTPGRHLPNYVRVIHPDACVFSVAGTTDWLQMLDNVLFSGQIQDAAFGPGWMHSYFLWCAKGIAPLIAADLAAVPTNTPICFTGHSLGGAIAQLLAVWFGRNSTHPVRQCVVFCSPKVGNTEWTNQVHGFDYRHYFNDRDWIVNLPPRFLTVTQRPDVSGITNPFNTYRFKPSGFFLKPGRFESSAMFGIVPWVGEVMELPFRAVGTMLGTQTRGALADHTWIEDHKLRTLLDIARPYTTAFRNDPAFADVRQLDLDLKATPLPDNPDGEGVPGQGNEPVENFIPPSTPPAPYPAPLPIVNPLPPALALGATAVEEFTSNETFTQFGAVNPPPIYAPGIIEPPIAPVERKNWLFKGEDRRLLLKLRNVFRALEARDSLLWVADPSSALSCRVEIFDYDEAAFWEAQVLHAHVLKLLAMERT